MAIPQWSCPTMEQNYHRFEVLPGIHKLSIEQLFGTVSNYKLGKSEVLVNRKPDQIKAEFKKYTGSILR